MKNLKLFIIALIVAVIVIAAANLDKVKENLSWMFEADDSHASLPELSNKEIEEVINKNKELEDDKTVDAKANEKNVNTKETLEEITE